MRGVLPVEAVPVEEPQSALSAIYRMSDNRYYRLLGECI